MGAFYREDSRVCDSGPVRNKRRTGYISFVGVFESTIYFSQGVGGVEQLVKRILVATLREELESIV